MDVRPPVPNPSLKPLSTDEVPADPAREDKPLAPPEGDAPNTPDLPNPVI